MVRALSFAVVLLAASSACAAERSVTLAVQNMTCATCPIAVRIAIRGVAGVKDVSVDFAKRTALITFDDAVATIEQLADASRLAGFPARRKE